MLGFGSHQGTTKTKKKEQERRKKDKKNGSRQGVKTKEKTKKEFLSRRSSSKSAIWIKQRFSRSSTSIIIIIIGFPHLQCTPLLSYIEKKRYLGVPRVCHLLSILRKFSFPAKLVNLILSNLGSKTLLLHLPLSHLPLPSKSLIARGLVPIWFPPFEPHYYDIFGEPDVKLGAR